MTQWSHTFDDTYSRPPTLPALPAVPSVNDDTFNISGWTSSYTSDPIPPDEMRQWLDETVARIRQLQPRRILELGCGTGMLLYRLAPDAETYVGTDFSAQALDALRRGVERRGLPQVRLLEREARDFSDLPDAAFDAVILNSVIQYFPGVDYLMNVLDGAFRSLAQGGSVILGDLRNRNLLRAFHASVQSFKANDSVTRQDLRARVHQGIDREEELTIDPALFAALRSRFPQITGVDVRLKSGSARNELTTFRYDVVLGTGPTTATRPAWIDWNRHRPSLAEIRAQLRDRLTLSITNIPNARLASDQRCLEWLDGLDDRSTVAHFRRAGELGNDGIDPSAFTSIASEAGCDVMLRRMTCPEGVFWPG